jgi:hypothetical protein
MGMRSKSAILVLVALEVGAGCASSYRPVVSPRVQVIQTGSGQAFMRGGQQYDHGLWGEGLGDAVAGVPAAVAHANTYRNLQIGGFVCSLTGGAALGVGLGAALREAPSDQPGGSTATNVVLLSGAALAVLGGLLYMQSQPYLWDAINVHNDSVQRARPPVPTPPAGAAPAGH